MTLAINRQKMMLELEEKAKKKQLKKYVEKIKEIETLKKDGKYEEPLPLVRKQITTNEMIEQIDKGRKERFQEDIEAMKMAEKSRKDKLPRSCVKKDDSTGEYLGIMYPVDPEVLAELYTGISHNDEGRRKYLKMRNHLDPSERYIFSQTLNNDYGWKIDERKWPTFKKFAKVEIVNRTFYRRCGVKGETLRNREPAQNEKPSSILL